MAGIKITLVDDVSSFLRGTQRAEEALDDVADSLDDLARDAQRDGRKIGDDLAKGVDAGTEKASDSVRDMERSFSDLARGVQRESKKAGDDIGDNIGKGSRDAERSAERVGDAFREAGDEAGSSAREAAASFSGEVTDIADFAQETLANAFTGFGPVGAAAGLAAAAGLGALWTSISDNSEASKQIVADMYESMKESGAAYVEENYIRQASDDIIQGADNAIVSMDRVRETVEATGLSAGTVIRAYAGDAAAMAEVIGTAADKQRELQDEATAANTSQIAQLQDVQDSFDGTNEKLDGAREKYESWNQVVEAAPTEKVLNMEVNDDPARIGLGNLYTDIENARPGLTPELDTASLDAQVRAYRPPRVLVSGELEVRHGMRAV